MAAKARHFHSVFVWPSVKRKTRGMDSRPGWKCISQLLQRPYQRAAGYQLARWRKLAGVRGCRTRRSGTEATQRSDGQGRSAGLSKDVQTSCRVTTHTHTHTVHMGEKGAAASLTVPSFLVFHTLPDTRASNRINPDKRFLFCLGKINDKRR